MDYADRGSDVTYLDTYLVWHQDSLPSCLCPIHLACIWLHMIAMPNQDSQELQPLTNDLIEMISYILLS